MKNKILVLACPRSGTHFTAELLRRLGLDVGHDCIRRDGAVSSFLAAEEPLSPRPMHDRRAHIFGAILHQVRNPCDTISSLAASVLRPDHWRFFARHVSLTSHPVARRVELWCVWNQLCERQATWTFRVEDLLAGTAVFRRLCARCEVKARWPTGFGPESVRSFKGRRQPLRPGEWEALPENLRHATSRLAERYGYARPPRRVNLDGPAAEPAGSTDSSAGPRPVVPADPPRWPAVG